MDRRRVMTSDDVPTPVEHDGEAEAATSAGWRPPPALIPGLLVGLLLGLVLQAAIAGLEPHKVIDVDEDGIPDDLDLDPNGDAMLRIVVASVEHDPIDEDAEALFTFGYHDDGGPLGAPGVQLCPIIIQLRANLSTAYPAASEGACLVQMDDYARRAVSFDYVLTHEPSSQNPPTAHWDLMPHTGDDTAGVNLTADPALLHARTTIVLDGMDDGDDHAFNAAVTLIISPARG